MYIFPLAARFFLIYSNVKYILSFSVKRIGALFALPRYDADIASANPPPYVKIMQFNLSTPRFFLNSSATRIDVAYLSLPPSLIISNVSSGLTLGAWLVFLAILFALDFTLSSLLVSPFLLSDSVLSLLTTSWF